MLDRKIYRKKGSCAMPAIKQSDFIQSIADAFQFISYYHPLDYITALGAAYEREKIPLQKTRSPRS